MRRAATRRSVGWNARRVAFTLIELLVVVAIVAVLISILLPALGRARKEARVVVVHSDLRQICLALDGYALDNRDDVPPTRVSCADDVQYRLPVELAEEKWFARNHEQISGIPQSEFYDAFDPQRTYRYRAPGPVWENGTFYDCDWPRSLMWVPEDFPQCRSEEGEVYSNAPGEPVAPVLYAVWSIGPDKRSAKFPRLAYDGSIDAFKFPLPRQYWLEDAGGAGLIVHFRERRGAMHRSP